MDTNKIKKWTMLLLAFVIVAFGLGSSAVIIYRSVEIAMELSISVNFKYGIIAGVALSLLWMQVLILDFAELICKKGYSMVAVPIGEEHGPE
jgi:hypothetical protein